MSSNTGPTQSSHRQSVATSRAAQISRIRESLRRPRRSTRSATETDSTESRLTALRLGTGSTPGSSTTSLASPRMVGRRAASAASISAARSRARSAANASSISSASLAADRARRASLKSFVDRGAQTCPGDATIMPSPCHTPTGHAVGPASSPSSSVLVPGAGFEPARPFGPGGLSPLRLPVPPPGPVGANVTAVVLPSPRCRASGCRERTPVVARRVTRGTGRSRSWRSSPSGTRARRRG
jgi:hypothetical protein